jgi:hypothetical protein
MLRTIAFVLLLLAGGCDSAPTTMSVKEAATVLEKCLAKRGLKVRDHLIFHAATHAVGLCHEQVGMDVAMRLSAEAAKYIVEGQECTKASRIMTRLYDNIGNDFKKDGEDKFCAWVSQMVATQNSDLWLRFAR